MSAWTKITKGYYDNSFAGVEIYRLRLGWYARNPRTAETSGPVRTMREAKIRAYEIVGNS